MVFEVMMHATKLFALRTYGELLGYSILLIRVTAVKVCDARDDDSSNAVG